MRALSGHQPDGVTGEGTLVMWNPAPMHERQEINRNGDEHDHGPEGDEPLLSWGLELRTSVSVIVAVAPILRAVGAAVLKL